MFPEGAGDPTSGTRVIIQKLAEPLKATPYRVSITGQRRGNPPSRRSPVTWGELLSADRADAVRQRMREPGYPSANFYEVAGKADADQPVPRRYLHRSRWRGVAVTLRREAPPVPPDLKP